MVNSNNSAQGSTEFLIILSVIGVCALLIVGLFFGIFDSKSADPQLSKIKYTMNSASQTIQLSDGTADSNGDTVFVIGNSTDYTLHLVGYSVDNNEFDLGEGVTLKPKESKSIFLPNIGVCSTSNSCTYNNIIFHYSPEDSSIVLDSIITSISISKSESVSSDFAGEDGLVCITQTGSEGCYPQSVVSSKLISSFNFASPVVTGIIDEEVKTVSLTVPFGTNVTALVPTIAISSLATISPLSGVAQNFTSPVPYTVIAQNGSTQNYIVSVSVIPEYSVTYNGNTNDSGSAPTDASTYMNGELITVLGEGTLAKTGYTFDGWNTAANGSGTDYGESDTFEMGSIDVNLYAKWVVREFVCGDSITLNHVAGNISPVTTTIIYGTVLSSLSGSSKCWITQNIGASQQATLVTDNTDASAGWYWQFNRKQGYTGRTIIPYPYYETIPIWPNGVVIDEASDWNSDNDPCFLLFGSGWSIPNTNDYTVVMNGWNEYSHGFDSVLKLHAGGNIHWNGGVLSQRGVGSYYWSSKQSSSTYGYMFACTSSSCAWSGQFKRNAFPLRCIKSPPKVCGNGIIEGDEVCDSTFTNECPYVPGFYQGGYVNGGTCGTATACNSTCDNYAENFDCVIGGP